MTLPSFFLALGQVTGTAPAAPSDSLPLPRLSALKSINLVDLTVSWGEKLINFGIKVLIALAVFYIGRLVARHLLRVQDRVMRRRGVDPAVTSFLHSLSSVLLTIVVILIAISALGFQPVSFAALIASAGVGIGMGLSGQLQNLAGGLIILVTKPFKVGDHIVTPATEGVVDAVMIFHTVLKTFDNRKVYLPNGKLTSDVVTNVSAEETLRLSWTFDMEYNEDFERVRSLLDELIRAEERILTDPAHYIVLNSLADSSVKVLVRAYCKREVFWSVYWDINRRVYESFKQHKINIPFPQLTISRRVEPESFAAH